MSFFKKLISREELTEEQEAEKARLKEEKRIQREAATKERNERYQQEKAERDAINEAKKKAKNDLQEKFIGSNPNLVTKLGYSSNKKSIDYINKNMLHPEEKVLSMITAEFDKTQKREIKGILVSTDQKLIFASIGYASDFTEVFEYKKMNGISYKRDGFGEREIQIDYGRTVRKFDNIPVDGDFSKFLDQVKSQIARHKSGLTMPIPNNTSSTSDKYEQLEKLGKLKEQGILSDSEFQAEKAKILNNLQ